MANTIPQINIDDILELKKPHPCGSKKFKVLRVGSDIKLTCIGCSRIFTMERIKVEKMIRKITRGEDNNGN